SFLSLSSVTSGLRLWHGAACPLRRRLVDEGDVSCSARRLPVDGHKLRRRCQHLDGDRIGCWSREQRTDGERVAGAVHAPDADAITAGALRPGEDRDVEAAVGARGELAEAEGGGIARRR